MVIMREKLRVHDAFRCILVYFDTLTTVSSVLNCRICPIVHLSYFSLFSSPQPGPWYLHPGWSSSPLHGQACPITARLHFQSHSVPRTSLCPPTGLVHTNFRLQSWVYTALYSVLRIGLALVLGASASTVQYIRV